VQNDPVNWVDPTGLKIYDPQGIIPGWIKSTPLYKQLDADLSVIIFTKENLSYRDSFGVTRSLAPYGLIQSVGIDMGANKGGESLHCGGMSRLEDTILHEMNHASKNLSRWGQGDEDEDNINLPNLLKDMFRYKK